MDMQNKALEAQADLLAEDALHELGNALPDGPDEYAKQCDFAGCYPWLAEVICARPHDAVIHSALYGNEVAEEGLDACG